MASNAYDITYVAVTCSRPPVAILQFIAKAWNANTGEVEFEREVTDAAIVEEIAKAGLDMVTWRRLSGLEEVPADRTYRNAWEDDGAAIVIDPTRAAVIDAMNTELKRDPLAELDALQARVAALGG